MLLTDSGLIRNMARSQMRNFQGMLERNQLILRASLADRMAKDLKSVSDRYDGSAERAIEEKINNLYSKKSEVADVSFRVTSAIDSLQDLRLQLVELRENARTGAVESWNYHLRELNSSVGTKLTSPGNLMANSGQGRWSDTNTIVDGSSGDISVTNHFMGTDYAIELPGGGLITPNFKDEKLEGSAGTLAMGALTVSVPSTPPRDGDSVTFTDGATTVTGTLRMGGAKLGNAWLYNNLATDADRAQAMSDVDAALKRLDSVDREYRLADVHLTNTVNSFDTLMNDLSKDFERVSMEELEAKSAARKAIEARMQLTEQLFALSGTTSASFIEGLFVTEPIGGKKSLGDILLGANATFQMPGAKTNNYTSAASTK